MSFVVLGNLDVHPIGIQDMEPELRVAARLRALASQLRAHPVLIERIHPKREMVDPNGIPTSYRNVTSA